MRKVNRVNLPLISAPVSPPTPVERPDALRLLRDLRIGKKVTSTDAGAASPFKVWAQRLLVLSLLLWAISPLLGFTSTLTILALVGFAAMLVGMRKPVIGLLGIGMLATLDPLTRVYLLTGGLLRWNTLNYWLILVVILWIPLFLRLNDPHTRLLQVFILLLGLELLISAGWSEGIQDLLNLAATFGIVLYFARALPEKPNLYWLGILNGAIAATGGAMFYLLMDRLPYIDPNAWAFFPLTGLFSICLGFHFVKGRSRQMFYLLMLAVVNYVWIFLSGSRGGMLSGLFCLLYLILAARSISWTIVFLAAAVVLGVSLAIQFAGQQTYAIGRLQRMFDANLTLGKRTSGRSDLAVAGWGIFLNHPWGIGTGGFREEVESQNLNQGRRTPAHSAWIKALAENGFIGFLLLFAYVISFVVVGWQKRDQGLFLIGLLTTVVFASTFVSVEYKGKTMWFLGSATTVLLHQEELLNVFQEMKKNRLLRQYRRWTSRLGRRHD